MWVPLIKFMVGLTIYVREGEYAFMVLLEYLVIFPTILPPSHIQLPPSMQIQSILTVQDIILFLLSFIYSFGSNGFSCSLSLLITFSFLGPKIQMI